MPATTLGKRTGDSRETEPELPSKRPRRSTRSCRVFSDENADTATAIAVDPVEDKENQQSSNPSTTSKPKTEDVQHRKSSIPVTPSTPRHYDVFAKGTVTPRHRVMSVGKVSRRLTPQTPLTPSSCQTIYHAARQLFSRSSEPGQLVGREDERARLCKFLDRCSTPRPSGCLYVSGPPGTGKSAMTNAVTEELAAASPKVRKAYINCMSIKSSKELYVTLLDQLDLEVDVSEDDAVVVLQKIFAPKKKSEDVFLVVLDEIDHIVTLDLGSLYRLFEWSLQKTSRLALVGIANALDLTDRFLPRLKSRNLKPELLPFLPYTAGQIKEVLTSKLKGLMPADSENENYLPFFHPAAIELCSRKVSTQTGDLRRAFEICRRAIDLVESETRMKCENEVKEQLLQMSPSRKVLGENSNLASPPKKSGTQNASTSLMRSLQSLTVETAPRVSIGHLNKVTAAAFSNGTNQRLKTLNLQQKAALCALMALEKRNKAAKASTFSPTPSKSQVTAPTVKTLFDTYCLLCKQDSVLHPLSSSEFREVIGSLETLSLVAPVDGKTGSFAVPQTPSKRARKSTFGVGAGLVDEKRIASCVGDKEIEQAVEGLGADILRSILSGEALD
ncbi:Cell division control protein [Coniochaeta hoffmannii]|uniref:Cell division control protein n=1 Tax=Coniochaeta hoffmannii TaxID=91930 RepID=A0AA38SCU3_9PEZI|nr:Cell division control protein [Coniochaeta hoffmannii]